MWVGRDNQEIADSLPYLFFLLTWQVGCFEVDQTEVTIVKTKIYTPVFKNVVNLKICIKYIYLRIFLYFSYEKETLFYKKGFIRRFYKKVLFLHDVFSNGNGFEYMYILTEMDKIFIFVKILFEFADMHTRNKPRISASQY